MGVTIETIPLAAGYWRVDTTSDNFLECKEDFACQGTNYTLWKQLVWPLRTQAPTVNATGFDLSDVCASG